MDAYFEYNQIPMYKPNEKHTSFITNRGLYCYRVVPSSLKNIGATYKRLVNRIFKDLIGKLMDGYVDDMLVKSKIVGDHIEYLNQMFSIPQKYQIKLNPLKCTFGVESDKFMGFMVNQRGIQANPEKISALLKMSSPRKPKEVMSLTSRVAILSQFVSRAIDYYAAFFNVLKRCKKFEWMDKCE